MDIDGWLRGIGLEQYAQTFRDNAINADVLRKAIGEPPEDPLLLFLLLTGYVVANGVAGNVKACRDVATSILSLAEKQQASAPLMLGHICVGYSLLLGGEITEGKAHLGSDDRALRSCGAPPAAFWHRPKGVSVGLAVECTMDAWPS